MKDVVERKLKKKINILEKLAPANEFQNNIAVMRQDGINKAPAVSCHSTPWESQKIKKYIFQAKEEAKDNHTIV